MKRIFIILILFKSTILFCQTEKTLESAVKIFNSGEIERAILLMDTVINNNPSIKNWNTQIDMYKYKYEHSTDLATLFGNSLGINSESSGSCFNKLISKCKEAELYSESTRASQLLRTYFIDTNPDSLISENARKEFNLGEEFFGNKDYTSSKKHYLKSLILQPDYYKATIYLGDSYWYLGNIDSAIYFFKKGIELNPNLLEPRKYLVDALGYANRNEEAKKECIEAIIIYPDKSMFMKYSDLVKRDGKVFNKHWVKRECQINTNNNSRNKTNNITWIPYQQAGEEIKNYCDSNGNVIKVNEFTKSKFQEVYSWERMIQQSKADELLFAKKMESLGYLDCYVFISEYHFDLYNQFTVFARNNKEKIKTYIEKYLVE